METEISQENSKIIKPTEEQPKDETNKVHPLMGNSPVLDEFLKLAYKLREDLNIKQFKLKNGIKN